MNGFDPAGLVIFLVFGAVAVLVHGYGNAAFSGWRTLARRYPERAVFAFSDGLHGQTVRFGEKWLASEYIRSVTVRVDDAGLHISQGWIMRIGHPPIAIPWSSIEPLGLVTWFFASFDSFRVDGQFTIGFRAASAIARIVAPYVDQRPGEVLDHR